MSEKTSLMSIECIVSTSEQWKKRGFHFSVFSSSFPSLLFPLSTPSISLPSLFLFSPLIVSPSFLSFLNCCLLLCHFTVDIIQHPNVPVFHEEAIDSNELEICGKQGSWLLDWLALETRILGTYQSQTGVEFKCYWNLKKGASEGLESCDKVNPSGTQGLEREIAPRKTSWRWFVYFFLAIHFAPSLIGFSETFNPWFID